MKQFLKNERGNGMLFTIFNLAVVGAMMILILNIAMLYTKKEQASIAAEQASLAATSVVYDKVNPVVTSHVKKILIGIDKDGGEIFKFEPLIEKLDEAKDLIRASNPDLSENEVHIKGVNQVLISELSDDEELMDKINSAISSAKYEIPNVIKSTIKDNRGKDGYTEYEWSLTSDYRIEVFAKAEFEAVHYRDIDFGDDGDIKERGLGPAISFLGETGW